PAELRIEKCTEHLLDNGRKGWLTWLQSSLLEAIYVRVIPDIRQIRPKEPVFWHSYLLDEPSPFVPYTRDQESAVKDPYFLCLLDAVGLVLPNPKGIAYPVIPSDMLPHQMFDYALKLGAIHPEKLNFNPNDISVYEWKMFQVTATFDSAPDKSSDGGGGGGATGSSIDAHMWPNLVHLMNNQLAINQQQPQKTA
ncbi:hypothetical protein CAPTEDRAFT_209961, partial [Capitella teleta]